MAGLKTLYFAGLDLEGVEALVVGGGAVGLQKARELLRCGARVRVVAPRCRPALKALLKAHGGSWARRAFRARDLKGAAVVFAAADSREVNARVAALARRGGLWVGVADRPGEGNLSVPAVARAGRLNLAVSTSGASPALAKALRRSLEKGLGRSALPRLLGRLEALRPVLKRRPARKKKLLAALTRPEFFTRLLKPESPALGRALDLLLREARGSD